MKCRLLKKEKKMDYRMKNCAIVPYLFIGEWQRRWNEGQTFNCPLTRMTWPSCKSYDLIFRPYSGNLVSTGKNLFYFQLDHHPSLLLENNNLMTVIHAFGLF